MSNTIQVKAGAKVSLPTLNAREFGFTTDTYELFIGKGVSNLEILTHSHIIDEDNMVSDLATKLPTQQSVKAYVGTKANKGANADITSLGALSGAQTIPTINLTGGQIAFPATAVPSTDANTLDDYEEGSFTPIISFGGASVGITYASQLGFYTKIGNRVIFDISIELTSKGTSTGSVLINELPFSILNRYTSVSLQFNRITFANVFQGRVVYNTSTIELTEVTEAGVRTPLTDADFADNSGSWQISAAYPMA